MPAQQAQDVSAHPPMLPWWGRISLLWLMCVPIMVAMYSLCIGIVPHDFWWHARVGGIIAATGRVPTTNIFSVSLPADTPYVYQSWLAELLFYEILRWGGLAWIVVGRSLCVSGAFALMVVISYRRALVVARDALTEIVAAHGLQPTTATPYLNALATPLARLTAFGALLTLMLTAPSMEVRPQIFSVPLFALFSAALLEWSRWAEDAATAPGALWHRSGLLTPAMLLWANLHGAFCTGLIVLGIFCCGEAFFAWWPASQRKETWGKALSVPGLASLVGLLLLCALAALINPRGVGIYFYVVRLAGDPPSQKYIAEWQSPTWGNAIHDVFFCSPLLLILLARYVKQSDATVALPGSTSYGSYGRYGIRAAELLVLVALAVMTWRDVRSLVWYALFYMPLFSACGAVALVRLHAPQWFAPDTPPPVTPTPARNLAIINAGMALLLLGLIVPTLPWVKPYLPLPLAFQARFAPNPAGRFPLGFSSDPPLLLDRLNPVEAVDFLRQHPPRRRLFTEMGYGSYVIWMLYPAQRPSADTRVELYPLSFWDEYFRLSRGPADAPQRLAAQGFSDALLDTGQQAGLVKRLKATPGWRVLFSHDHTVLLRYLN